MPLSNLLSTLFAVNSVQFWWYITRSAGLMGYFLIWLSTAWGIVVSSKIKFVERTFTYDFHEYLSWLGLAFIGVHVVVLLADKFLPYNIWQVLVPFLSPYRPLWVGIGVIAFYLSLLVTITFYMKAKIGASAFRKIHYLSFIAYFGATLHGLYAGTDSVLPIANLLYKGTLLITLFLTVYWLVMFYFRKREREEEEQLNLKNARQKARYAGKSRSTNVVKNSR